MRSRISAAGTESDHRATGLDGTAARSQHLKLMIVTHFFPAHAGGIELVAEKLAHAFSNRGVAIRWFSSDTDVSPVGDPSKFEYVPVGASNIVEQLTQLPYPFWSPIALPMLWRAIGTADVIHIHEHLYSGNMVVLIMARLRRCPVVLTQHMGRLGLQNAVLTWLFKFGTQFLGKLLFPMASHRVFISANVRRFFGRESDPRSSLIFNGVDTRCFRNGPEEERRRVREGLAAPPDRKVVLFVGRFVRKKGLGIIERLTCRFPSILWIMIGSGPEDPNGWNRTNVRVLGRLNHAQLADHYRLADLLLLPSSGEGFPLVVQEALCCGTGVLSTQEVASACPAASGMLRSCETPRGDRIIDAWEHALAETLADYIYLNARDSRAQQASSLWSWDRCADQYLQLFSEVCSDPRSRELP